MPSSPTMYMVNAMNAVCHDTTEEMQSIIFPSTVATTSYFTTHQMKPAGIRPVPFTRFSQDWIFAIFLICFILLAWIQVGYGKRFRQILQAPLSKRFHNQMLRDGNLFKERISVALGIIYFLTAALMIYEVLLQFPDPSVLSVDGISLYLLILASLFVFWLLKISTIRILETIFKTYHASGDYLLNVLLINSIAGLLLLPVLLMAVYMKSVFFLDICLILFSILFVFRLVRGFVIGLSYSKFSYLLLFVYLCTLEILPLIVLAKLVLAVYHSTQHVY
jgi:hypothetical protein